MADESRLITVSGTGVATGSPNIAEITVGVSVISRVVKDARTQAAAAMSAVIDVVKKLGIPDRDVQTQYLTLNPTYDYSGSAPKLTGYQFASAVRITVRELDKLSSVIDQSAAVGATTIQSVEFRIEDPGRLESEARKLAMADARARADALAALAGVSIKGIASISESTGEAVPPRPFVRKMAMAADTATPVESGTTDVTVNVTVGYLI